jgi:hypothetical protein
MTDVVHATPSPERDASSEVVITGGSPGVTCPPRIDAIQTPWTRS